MPENVRFGLPPEIVQAIASAPGAQTGPRIASCRGSNHISTVWFESRVEEFRLIRMQEPKLQYRLHV